MIQRPQTLYFLAVVAICMMLIFAHIPFFEAETVDASQTVVVAYDETKTIHMGQESTEINTHLLSIFGGISILSLVSMLLFRNRKMQSLLASVNYLLILGLIALMYYNTLNQEAINSLENQSFTYFALLPMILLFFNYLALRGIKKDEALIRSMDRLR
jgi:predicted ferric reductase